MAQVAVNKDGSEIISDFDLYRNGYYRRYMKCNAEKCKHCLCLTCEVDENGKRYKEDIYANPPEMNKEKSIELLSFWDNFEFDSDCNKLNYIVSLPKGSIKKLIGRELTWEDDPVTL